MTTTCFLPLPFHRRTIFSQGKKFKAIFSFFLYQKEMFFVALYEYKWKKILIKWLYMPLLFTYHYYTSNKLVSFREVRENQSATQWTHCCRVVTLSSRLWLCHPINCTDFFHYFSVVDFWVATFIRVLFFSLFSVTKNRHYTFSKYKIAFSGIQNRKYEFIILKSICSFT